MAWAVPDVKARVLVVDDNTVRLTLEHSGYEVQDACDGVEGVKLQERAPHDIAIIDMVMPPSKGGVKTIMELKEMYTQLCILAMSGAAPFAKINYLEAAMLLGATAILEKPFEGDKLINTLDAFASV